MLPKAARRGQHFQVRGHSFFSKLMEKKTHASVAVCVNMIGYRVIVDAPREQKQLLLILAITQST